MNSKAPVYYDLETVALLRGTLDDAWASLRAEQRATISRAVMAELILRAAAKGERNPERLRHAALAAVAA